MRGPTTRRHSRSTLRRLARGLACAALLAGCGAPAPRPLNVLVVMLDTLRADHVGAYGYPHPTTPALDALAARSHLFESARAQSSCTFPSVNSLLTSRYPARFLNQPGGSFGIPESIPSLAEMLAARGWQTAAVSASPIVRANPGHHNPHGGFGRGFATFDEHCEWRFARCVTSTALATIGRLQEPFFAYLHYLDPHDPYRPPAEFGARFTRGTVPWEWAMRGDPNPIAAMLYRQAPAVEYDARAIRHLEGLYDGEIAFLDSHLGRLFDTLERDGRLERTVVVVVSDHGESFLEHGHVKHCRTLYEAEIRTPLLVRLPGQVEGARHRAPVQHVDVVPTLLELLGVEPEGAALEGRSLVPLLEGEPLPDGLAFATIDTLRSVTDGRRKLILDLRRGTREMYDLAADPGERHDVARDPRSAAALRRLRAELRGWIARTEGETGLGPSEEAQRRLEALGYL